MARSSYSDSPIPVRGGLLVRSSDGLPVDEAELLHRILSITPTTLAAGTGVTLDARGLSKLSLVIPAGATATVSQVDTSTASGHDADSTSTYTANTVLEVAWPFYRVSVTVDDLRYCLVG